MNSAISEKPFTVEERTIYALSMPKFVYIQMYVLEGSPAPSPARIRADTLEQDDNNKTVLKLGDQKVGEFQTHTVAGWWIQDES